MAIVSTPTSNPNDSYTLRGLERIDLNAESERLSVQYYMLKERLGRTSPLPPEIDLSTVSAILDVAAGNCVWILDVANQSKIKERREKADIELYACDIDLAKFPPSDILSEHEISSFQLDVTKPFPEHMKNKFDLIHISIVITVLTREQWEVAIQSFRDALKPGGYLLILDSQAVMYPAEQTMPPSSWKWGDSDALNANPAHYLNKHNSLLYSMVSLSNRVFDLAYFLPILITNYQMHKVAFTPIIFPVGHIASDNVPQIAPQVSSRLLNNYISLFAFSLKNVLKRLSGSGREFVNPLTNKTFKPQNDFQEVDDYAGWLRGRFENEGVYFCFFEFVGRKPAP